MHESRTVLKLAEINLKLSDATLIINKTLSPVLFFSFGITFSMLSIFVFLLLFIGEYWIEITWFAIVNSSLNMHLFLVMLGVIWACEATIGEGKTSVKLLFRALITSKNDEKNKKVSFRNYIKIYEMCFHHYL